MQLVRSRSLGWTITGALALVIAVLSLMPNPEEIVPVTLWDKLSHFLAYGALAFALGRALALSGWVKGRLLAAAILLSTAYGALMEGAQFFAPPRTPELLDLFSDFLGSCIGMACLVLLNLVQGRFARHGQSNRTV
jgi:VanZ family protein